MSPGWDERGERGSLAGLLFVRRLALSLGRPAARLALYPAVLWYLIRAREEQRHVRDFLRRVLPRRPRLRDVARTYWNFGAVTLDRVFLLSGRDSALDVRVHNAESLLALHRRRSGAILAGAHLGSFEAMRALGLRREGLRIRILQYVDQSPRVTGLLAELDSGQADAIIPLGSVDVLLDVSDAIGAGEFVAMLPDRVKPADSRTIACEFLGGTAQFAAGGFEAALILGCPVLFVAGLYHGGNRYDLHFELLNEGAQPVRAARSREVERLVRGYARCLERYARAAPHNWFNFYPYWGR